MRLRFTRTGGIVAAPGLDVRGSATLDYPGAAVTAERGYARPLTPDEAAGLRTSAGAVLASSAGQSADPPIRRGRDVFRFAIEIDAGTRSAEWRGLEEGDAGDPALEALVAWVSREAMRIARSRLE